MLSSSVIFWSVIGGFLPSLVWLFFWLREDEHHEPRKVVIYGFLAGMLAVPVALILQLWVNSLLNPANVPLGDLFNQNPHTAAIITVLLVIIEEVLKFGAGWIAGRAKKKNLEPIDAAMYMMASAFGFAALENAIYMLSPLQDYGTWMAVITLNVRFLGANLVHFAASTAIGISLGLAFYENIWGKFRHLLIGFSIAIALHTIFNLFIMTTSGAVTFIIFAFIWLVVAVAALFFEKLKFLYYQHNL
jgi:RsiW-degrading membrane proteinase PrsW (M82 family)